MGTVSNIVSVTIDGQKTQAEKGTFVLQVAKKLNIRIPTLCHFEHVEPYGACRMCIVEVKRGKRVRMVTACNYPVVDGLEIFTKSERVLQNRRMNLKLLMKRCEEVPVLADLAKEQGLSRLVLDRGGYLYHGRVAALARGLRDGGIEL